jgi:DNA polymerase-3 subunit beta
MNIQVEKELLLKGIQTVSGAVSSKATLPILGNLLLEAEGSFLRITATDLDIAISTSLTAKIDEPGSVTVPARRFLEIVKESSTDHPLRVEVKRQTSIVIESGKTIFRLVGTPKTDFPKIPAFEAKDAAILPQKLLKDMIRLTAFAVSRDEARYVLNGVLLVLRDKTLRLVATDGRRLALVERTLEKPCHLQKNLILPSKAVQELSHALGEEGDVELGLRDNQLQARIGGTTLTTRLIEGEFPNYEQVIPRKTKELLILNTQEFLSAARRASIFTQQDSQSVKLELTKNRLVISKSAPDVGEVREEIEVDYGGSEMAIGFNPSYLTDALKNISDEKVQFGLTDPEKPGIIKAREDYTYIVLPMQLS